MDPAVLAEHLARGVDDVALARPIRQVTRDKPGGIAVWNKADLVAVRLRGSGKAALFCVGAYLRLREVSDREQGVRELLLGEREQEVRLVFFAIDTSSKAIAPRVFVEIDLRVVAGGHRRRVEAGG